MSKYSLDYLRNHTLVGDVAVNGLPWTARCLAVDVSDVNSEGRPWLFDGAVPLPAARELLDSFSVSAHPLVALRPAMPWDDQSMVIKVGDKEFFPIVDDTRQIVVDDKRDRIHFVPKSGYVVHPFTETLIERTARIVSESSGDLHIDSVGVLADGGEGWVSIATGSLVTLPEGVEFYSHVLASSSHNGTLATSMQAVNTMTVCDNTRAMALGEGKANGTVTKSRHSRKSAEKLESEVSEAARTLGLITQAETKFAEQVKFLCEMPVSDKDWNKFLDELAPVKDDMAKAAVTRAENYRDSVSLLYRNDKRNQWTGTAFGALQAVNTFDLHERGVWEKTDRDARNIRDILTDKITERETVTRNTLMKVLGKVKVAAGAGL